MKNPIQIKKFLLFLGDLIVMYSALYLALALRYLEKPADTLWQNHFWPFTIIFLAWLFIFYLGNLYNLNLAINNKNFFRLTNRSLLIAILISIIFFYADPQVGIAPKTTLILHVFIFYFLFFLWRRLFNWMLQSYLPKENIAIIGWDEQTKSLITELGNANHFGYKLCFVVNDKSEAVENTNGIKVINGIENFSQNILEEKITTIVLNSNPHESPALRDILFNCLSLKLSYITLPNFYENITGRVPIETINQMWFLENLSEGNKNAFDLFKRTYDLVLAFIIFAISLPFWPLIALIIKLESKGPVLFKQIRSGKDNQPFMLYKFRTMKEEGNDRSLTAANDNRITRFGNFLRKTRIDEIPQLINILKGEMSFVGPRPERPEYIEELKKTIPFYKERMLVNPGLTGWDQISGEYHSPSPTDSFKKLQYDLFYIKNRSIYLDLSIILKTITTVLSRGGR